MTVKVQLSKDQESFYHTLQGHKKELAELLPGSSPDEIMRCSIEYGLMFCVFLDNPPAEQAEMVKRLASDPMAQGFQKLIVWLWHRGVKVNGPSS